MPLADNFETILVLSPIGTPPYSARGVVQTLVPIQQAGNLVRDINGTLVDLSDEVFQKYASHLECTDIAAPGLNGIWPGQAVTVDCVIELAYLTSGGTPSRSVVSGSSRTDGSYTFYRPQLTMMITGYSQSFDEWECQYTWSMDLEEV